MNPELAPNRRRRTLATVCLFGLAVACGAFASLSLLHAKLYSPIGVLVTHDSSPTFYIGISIYITIGATVLSTALIRIALDLSK